MKVIISPKQVKPAVKSNNAIKNVFLGREGMRKNWKSNGESLKTAAKDYGDMADKTWGWRGGHKDADYLDMTPEMKAHRKSREDWQAGGLERTKNAAMETINNAESWAFGKDFKGEGSRRAGVIAARGAMIGGGAFALGSAGRLISGNTPMTNSQGERDIAGIPFI